MRIKRVFSVLLACALMLTGLAVAAPAATAQTIPMTWKKFDKAYVVLELDASDGISDVNMMNTFYDILTEYGFPLCISTTTESMSIMKLAALRKVEDHGGEITSHTHSGKVLNSSVSWDVVDYEFKKSLDVFKDYGFNVNGIMLMGGGGGNGPNAEDTSEAYRAQVEQYVSKYYKYSDKYGVSAQYYNPRYSLTIGGLSIKEKIDDAIANKSWVSLFTHGFNDDNITENYLRYILDYLKEKEDAGELEVVTYKHIYENLANWQGDVDFGDTKYTVDFYSTDNKTLLTSSVVVEGGSAELPLLDVANGVVFKGWSASTDNVTGNMSVYAQCSYADGSKVETTDASPLKLHTHAPSIVNETPATCVSDGVKEHFSCTCGKLFADASAAVEITDPNSLVIKATDTHADADNNGKCDNCAAVIGEVPSVTTTTASTTTTAPDDTDAPTTTTTAPADTDAPTTTTTAPIATDTPTTTTTTTAPIVTDAPTTTTTAPIATDTPATTTTVPIVTNTSDPITSEPDTSEPNSSDLPDDPELSEPVSSDLPGEPDVSEPIESEPDNSDLIPEPAVDNDGGVLVYILIGLGAVLLIAAAVVGVLLYRKKNAVGQDVPFEPIEFVEPPAPTEPTETTEPSEPTESNE